MKMEGEEMRKPIRLIGAACSRMGIGKNGQLPWNLPKEFQFFLDTITTVSTPGKKNLVVWGRISWFSCPEAVPPHAHYLCHDFSSAVRLVSHAPLSHIVENIWVLGGSEVYRGGLEHPWCDCIYLTEIMADFDCDVFFPEFDHEVFRKQTGFPGVPDDIHEENGIRFQFQVYKKIAN
ncbi:hypothetical protein DNTS_009252 [Danionella cerebrum]|uniref:dihydrofolate reductase n=1 Tax=Danionella cerebrum TaxID=2873325 RepID=A0A553Q5M9_9TELE|nr:hypothetical protein DNTS_009252 [Danionella translucida]